MDIAKLLLILLLIGYVIVKRLAGQPLTSGRLALVPLVLVGLGGYQLLQAPLTGAGGALLAAEVVLGLGVGLVRGLTIDIYQRGAHLWYRYRPLTVLIWLLTIGLRLGFGLAAHGLGIGLPVAAALLGVGASLLGEGAIVWQRARRTGVPFAPDRRTARATAGPGR